MAFKATSGKSGLEIHGLEAFIEKKFTEFKKALGLAARKIAPKKKAAAKKAPAKKSATPLDQLMGALASHSKGAQLARAGKQKDQLLRSLIPLYLARNLGVEISSGTTSKFWARHGVKFAAPNAAKALREHVGYARRTAKGPQITPNGVKYVEAAISGKKKAA
jgi:hypothetical protein